MQDINSNTFEELLNKPGKIALDFSGSWCKPCSQMTPILEKASKRLEDITFYKVDVDTNKDIVQMYGIKSIPTVVLINNGQVVGRFTGSFSEDDVVKKLSEMCN